VVLQNERSAEVVITFPNSRILACETASLELSYRRRRVPESRLKRDVHPKAAMIEAWTGAETEVTLCL
jgi:hypothetical protein